MIQNDSKTKSETCNDANENDRKIYKMSETEGKLNRMT